MTTQGADEEGMARPVEPSLHPALARIAVEYDQVAARAARGELSPAKARELCADLVARDDQGVRWRISPTAGTWERQDITGAWTPDSPPAIGLPQASAHDISGQGRQRFNPDQQIWYSDARTAPESLEAGEDSPRGFPTRTLLVLSAAAALAYLVIR